MTKNPMVNKTTDNAFHQLLSNRRQAALSLPFFDDFYQTAAHPNPALWQDNFVFINQTFPINPISIGVASFDGTNSVGNPYSTNPEAIGLADKLTSQPIDLSGLTLADNVWLSFFYEYLSNGEPPEAGTDYVLIQFLDDNANWNTIKRIDANNTEDFKQVFIQIDSPYLYNNFQFRFQVNGNLGGVYDIWNIDYVKLDKNRDTAVEKNIFDMAYQYPVPSLLKNYYVMPYSHFDSSFLAEPITLSVRNNFIFTTTDYVDQYTATIENNATTINSYNGPSIDLQPQTINPFNYNKINIPTGLTDDTVTIKVDYSFATSAEASASSVELANNMLTKNQVFSNFFAYDDASPERGFKVYSISPDETRMAVKYKLSHADTLQAVKMQFVASKYLTNSQPFSIVIYKTINVASNTDEVIYKHDGILLSDLSKEFGYDTINNKVYYALQADYVQNGYGFPLVLNDSFYIGIVNYYNDSPVLGLDINHNNNTNTYVNYESKWYRMTTNGAVLINAVVGSKLPGYLTPIKENLNTTFSIKLYPNPATTHIYLSGIKDEVEVAIFNINGQQVLTQNINKDKLLNIQTLSSGMYLVRVTNTTNGSFGVAKFIKQDE
ncbi:MAG: T9SS type A sorting domain-containing protein [Chitinophagales bacterium]|nr:T9SS type A sorting domain-containing protein [Chitinophagales bacterium]